MSIKLKGVEEELARVKSLVLEKADVAGATSKMVAELRAATPVLTGLAKSSWVVIKNSNYDYFVRNTVDYIGELNAGSSKQAPKYFIESISLKYGRPVGTIVRNK